MNRLMQWEEIYCFQKMLPVLTRWQLFHLADDGTTKANNSRIAATIVQPDYIKKKRAPKGVPSFEIIWKDEQKCLDNLIPHQQIAKFLSAKIHIFIRK